MIQSLFQNKFGFQFKHDIKESYMRDIKVVSHLGKINLILRSWIFIFMSYDHISGMHSCCYQHRICTIQKFSFLTQIIRESKLLTYCVICLRLSKIFSSGLWKNDLGSFSLHHAAKSSSLTRISS